MRILLVNPGLEDDILQRAVREIPYMESTAFFAPHALAVVAALTPEEHEVVIHDEFVRGPVDEILRGGGWDVVGITMTTNKLGRTRAIVDLFRAAGLRGKLVVGGIGAATMMRSLAGSVDALFYGEAEETWPAFLEDVAAGRARSLYRQIGKPDMLRTPVPGWDLVARDIPGYTAVSVQTGRGCPFDCSFCDVIYTFGRRLRLKSIDQVIEEIRLVGKLGARMIMIADDNFTADRRYVKKLLPRMIELNNSLDAPIGFITQLDVTIADDDELLELLADANFQEVQIGIESTSADSLRDMNKPQNAKRDLVEAVRKIQSYGIVVMAHMIVGAESDDAGAFARAEEFLERASVTHHLCHPLFAPPGTRLWHDLKRQGRLVAFTEEMRDRLDVATNIVPARMSRQALLRGIADYWERVNEPERHQARALGFLRGVRRVPRVKRPPLSAMWKMRKFMVGMFRYFSFQVPADERKVFFTILNETRKHADWMMPRMMYVHTGWVMDRKRAVMSAALAREQADWEESNPGGVRTVSPTTLIADGIRERASEVFGAAYAAARARTEQREEVYRTVVEAVIDFNDRFGAEIGEIDDFHREQIGRSVERVFSARRFDVGAARPGGPEASDLPEDAPPPGFVREMLDAMECSLHIGKGTWED